MRRLLGVALMAAALSVCAGQDVSGDEHSNIDTLRTGLYATAGGGMSTFDAGLQSGNDVYTWQAGAGLRFSQRLSIEALYHEWDDVTDCAGNVCANDYRPKGYSVSGAFNFFTDWNGISPYIKAGVFANDHGSKDSWLAGAGVRWKMVGLEYQRIDKVFTGTQEAPVDSIVVTLTF